MSGIPFTFDGQHRRRPRQSLRGASVKEPSKVALVERAHVCRNRRERERIMDLSIRIIQSVVRGYLVRTRLRQQHKAKYWEIATTGDCTTLEAHGEQIGRLIKFFDVKDPTCGDAFVKHANQLAQYDPLLFTTCCNDPLWSIRIRMFIRIGIRWYIYTSINKRGHGHRAGLRFFQMFHEGCYSQVLNTEGASNLFVKVWLDLATSIDFFQAWNYEYEHSLELSPNFQPSDHLLVQRSGDVIGVLNILFDFLSRMDIGPGEFVIERNLGIWKRYPESTSAKVPKEWIIEYLFAQFTDNFLIGNSIVFSATGISGSSPGELLFELLLSRNPSAKSSFLWKDWFLTLTPERYLKSTLTLKSRRHLLSAVIAALPRPPQPTTDMDADSVKATADVLCQLLPCIDNRFGCSSMMLLPESQQDDDDEMQQSWEQILLKKWIYQREYITKKLAQRLRYLPVVTWITTGIMNPLATDAIIGCLVCNNFKEDLIEEFPFLGQLANNRTYMEALYKQVDADELITNESRFVNFIWLFHLLMGTFHDVEFVDGLRMTAGEFMKLVTGVVRKYTGNVLKSSPHWLCAPNQIYSAFLMASHERNTRLRLFPEEVFQSEPITSLCPVRNHEVSMAEYLRFTVPGVPSGHSPSKLLSYPGPVERMMIHVLKEYPFALPFHDRVAAWRRMINLDKADRFVPHGRRSLIKIRRSMLYEDTFEEVLQIQEIRDPITISLTNKVGVQEAGVDGGGLLREFLIEATKAGVDPNRGLFRPDSQNRIYPNPIAQKIVPDHCQHFYLLGRLVGKALYEGTFLELPFSAFFLQKLITVEVDRPVDYLATLDPGLHSNLLGLKSFVDFGSLGLDFTMTLNELGETRTVELKEGGSGIAVDETNVIQYIHLVANYKINKEVAYECMCFRTGLTSVIPVTKIFSWREIQTLISGSDKPIDIEDWKNNTNFGSGYQADNPTIVMFWQVLETFDERHRRKLLKFVTSCSRPPLQGFKDLTPNFGIQSAGPSDRLPTAATCMNLLKLPEYEDVETMREKLIYAIEAEAGFELS